MSKKKCFVRCGAFALSTLLAIGASGVGQTVYADGLGKAPTGVVTTEKKVVIPEKLGAFSVLNYQAPYKNFDYDALEKALTDAKKEAEAAGKEVKKEEFADGAMEQITFDILNSAKKVLYHGTLKDLLEKVAKGEIKWAKEDVADGKLSFKVASAEGVDATKFAYNLEASKILPKLVKNADETYSASVYLLLADKNLTVEDTKSEEKKADEKKGNTEKTDAEKFNARLQKLIDEKGKPNYTEWAMDAKDALKDADKLDAHAEEVINYIRDHGSLSGEKIDELVALLKRAKTAEASIGDEEDKKTPDEKDKDQKPGETDKKDGETEEKPGMTEEEKRAKEEAEKKAAEEKAQKEKEEAERKAAEEKAQKEKEEAEKKAAEGC